MGYEAFPPQPVIGSNFVRHRVRDIVAQPVCPSHKQSEVFGVGLEMRMVQRAVEFRAERVAMGM